MAELHISILIAEVSNSLKAQFLTSVTILCGEAVFTQEPPVIPSFTQRHFLADRRGKEGEKIQKKNKTGMKPGEFPKAS